MNTEYGPVNPIDVDMATRGLHGVIAAREVYEHYYEVARSNHIHPGHITAVGQILVRMGFARRKKQGKTLYCFW
jgi:hypothetical protein